MRTLSIWLLSAFAVVSLAIVACGGDDDATTTPSPSVSAGASASANPTAAPLTGDITVFAASSLTAAFSEIGTQYEAAHSGVKVTFVFGGSQDLRTQMEQGADADVFGSADTTQMGLAKTSGVVPSDGIIFARNRLVIIVPKANSAGITTPQDLAKPGVKIVLAGETVPVGKYSRKFLDAAAADSSYPAGYKDAVLGNVVSEASNVKEVVSAVQLDEADAGIVYVTDVTSSVANDVTKIDIPDSVNQIATYPISITSNSANKATAQGFVVYVLGMQGQAALEAAGFLRAN